MANSKGSKKNIQSKERNYRGKKKKEKSRKNKAVLFFFIVVLLICYSAYGYLSSFSKNALDINNTSNKDDLNSVNFLIMGLDRGSGDENNKDDPRRTDTIMIAHYDKTLGTCDVVSVPRDTEVFIDGTLQKINAANAIGGVQYLDNAIEELLGVKLDYYVKIDTIAFRKIIDAIGGVDIVIDRDMCYDDEAQNLHINFEKSDKPQHLDGQKAENFVRWRKNNDGTGLVDGDLGRIKQQQKFYDALIEKVQSPLMIARVPKLLKILSQYVETDLSPMQIVNYGASIASMKKDNIRFHTLQGEDQWIDGISYYKFREDMNEDVLNILKNSGETSYNNDESKNEKSIRKENIRINILNGTSKQGLASNFQKYISSKGYVKSDVGNAGESYEKSEIKVYGVPKHQVEEIKKEFGIKKVQYMEEINNSYELEVILGDEREFIQ